MEFGLGKKTLSYSAISLWEKNKDQYRRRYYEKEPFIDTPEIIFGREVAKKFERGQMGDDPVLSRVLRYEKPEKEIKLLVGDIPFVGYIDSFDPGELRFLEYKTGRSTVGSKPRWDALSVAKHKQLDIYSLLIKEKYGEVTNLCHLIWIETRWKKETTEFNGHTLESDLRELELTGRIETFPRRIYEWERKKAKENIISLGHEIADDYEAYKRTNIRILPRVGAPIVAESKK